MSDQVKGGFIDDLGGGLGAGLGGAIGGVINNLINSGERKKAQEFQRNLAFLNSQQKYDLELKLLKAKTFNEQLDILSNAVASIHAAGLANQNKIDGGLIIALACVALVVAVVIFKQYQKK